VLGNSRKNTSKSTFGGVIVGVVVCIAYEPLGGVGGYDRGYQKGK